MLREFPFVLPLQQIAVSAFRCLWWTNWVWQTPIDNCLASRHHLTPSHFAYGLRQRCRNLRQLLRTEFGTPILTESFFVSNLYSLELQGLLTFLWITNPQELALLEMCILRCLHVLTLPIVLMKGKESLAWTIDYSFTKIFILFYSVFMFWRIEITLGSHVTIFQGWTFNDWLLTLL